MLSQGQPAPLFTLPSDTGSEVSLQDYKGKWIILYFYPKDNTPGCTKEACDFKEQFGLSGQNKVQVLGVSPDSARSHEKFRDKFSLPFPLLSDPEHKVMDLYSAWGEKKNYGKVYMGVIRSTFVIDPDGNIRKAYYNVKATGHVERLLNELENII